MNERMDALGSFQPVLEAYSTDIAHRRSEGPVTPHDGDWIAVGSLLRHARNVPEPKRRRLLSQVRRTIRSLLGDALWAQGPLLDARSRGCQCPTSDLQPPTANPPSAASLRP